MPAPLDAAALARGIVDGRTDVPAAAAEDERRALAWALKASGQAAWVADPPAAERAAAALHHLAQQAPHDRETAALWAWGRGIADIAGGALEPGLAALRSAADGWTALRRPLQAAQVGVAMLMPLALLGRFDEALALGTAGERTLLAHGDAEGAAKLALNLGSMALHRDRYDEAVQHYRRAAVRFARLGQPEHSVAADVGLADALGYAGRLDEAARICDRADMRARRHGLPVWAASAEHARSLLHLGAGRWREALAGLVRAQRAFARFEVDHYLTEVERDLADAYLELRLMPEALTLYDTLMQRLRDQGNEATLPWLQLQRARALAGCGRRDDAQAALDDAIGLFAAQDNTAGRASAALAQLELRLQAAAPLQAGTIAEELVQLLPALPRALAARARRLHARALGAAGRPAEAAHELAAWLQAAAPDGAPAELALAWCELGALQADAGRVDAAATLEQALLRCDDVRAALPDDETRLANLRAQLHAYRRRLQLALAAGEPADAVLSWMDRFRACTLGERLMQAGIAAGAAADAADADDAADAAHTTELATMRARLNWIRRHDQRRAQDGDGPLPAALQDEAVALEHRLLETLRRRRALRGTAAGGTRAGLDMAALQRAMVGRRALVEYGSDGDELLAVVVAQGQVHLCRGLARLPALRERVLRALMQLQAPRAGSTRLAGHAVQLLQRCRHHLQRLHDELWAPLAPLLGAADAVDVVLCDPLHALPLHALHDGSAWLDDRLCLRVLPSAALALARRHGRPPAASAGVGAAARPALLAGDASRLPHVRAELQAAAAALAPHRLLVDGAAQVAEVVAGLPAAGVVHLAGHAEYRADSPGFSALHLADGVLAAVDVEDLPLRARLVVLSACDTARALPVAGDEGLGLVRAFLAAGAREVAATGWAVDDEPTAQLMAAFFERWTATGDAARAMQSARGALRRVHPHPYHWAPFTLFGTGLDAPPDA